MKLNLSSSKQKQYIRRALLALLVLFVAMVQNVPWLVPIFGVSALPLIPLVVAIAVYDQGVPAVVLGAVAGAVWDVASPAHGLHAAYLAAIAFACSMLLRYIFNRNVLSMGLLSLLSTALYLLVRWFGDYAMLNSQSETGRVLSSAEIAWPLLRYSLPSLVYTMLLAPLCFWAVKTIVKKTSRRQREILAE